VLRGGWRWRVYYGGWGTAPYQSIYGPRRGLLESLPLMPEWYLAIALLALLAAAGAAWKPLLLALPVLAGAVIAVIADAALAASRARFTPQQGIPRLRLITGLLYLLQPPVRLYGRLRHGLTPWRRRGPRAPGLPLPRNDRFWCEQWQSTEERVRALMRALANAGSVVTSGGDWDRWDLYVRGGLLGGSRLRLAIEEHGAGRQLVRVRSWPHAHAVAAWLWGLLATLALLAALTGGRATAIVLAALAGALALRMLYVFALASGAVRLALEQTFAPDPGAERVMAGIPVSRSRPAAARPGARRPGVRDAAR